MKCPRCSPIIRRWLGLLPLCFLGWAACDYWAEGTLENLLWVCDVANLMLAIGMLASWSTLRRVATVMVLFGTPLWLWDLTQASPCSAHSVATHLGSALIGILTWREPRPQPPCWHWGTVTFVVLFVASRCFTPAATNVNIAFAVHPSLAGVFTSFPIYLALNLALGSLCAWGIEKGLGHCFKPGCRTDETESALLTGRR